MPDRTPDDMLRFRLVKFAERWAGTPYTLGASVEGVGADCLNWIQGFLLSAGVLMPPPSDQYPELPSAEEIESGEAGAFLLAAMDEAASRAAPGFRCSWHAPGKLERADVLALDCEGRGVDHAAVVVNPGSRPWVMHCISRQGTDRSITRTPLPIEWRVARVYRFYTDEQ